MRARAPRCVEQQEPSDGAAPPSPSFLIVNGGSHAERETPAPGRLPCGENGEECAPPRCWRPILH